VLACESDSTAADAVPSRRRLRSVDTMETVVVQFGVGSWPEAESGRSICLGVDPGGISIGCWVVDQETG